MLASSSKITIYLCIYCEVAQLEHSLSVPTWCRFLGCARSYRCQPYLFSCQAGRYILHGPSIWCVWLVLIHAT
jgi:hypothetical protein